MGITIVPKRFATPTSTGNVTWTDTNLGGLTPKAIMVVANHADTDGTAEAGLAGGVGFADDTREFVQSFSSEDGVTTSNAQVNGDPIRVIDTIVDGVAQVTASFVSFGVNSVTLNFSVVDSDAQLYTVVFFAGSDLSVYAARIGTVSFPTDDITDPGFEPDLVLFNSCRRNSAINNDLVYSFGVGVNDGSDTQRSLGMSVRHGQGTTTNSSHLTTTKACRVPLWSVLDWREVTISDYDANGFTLSPNNASFSALDYLALNFGGVAQASLRSFDSPTSTGDDARTGVGFEPFFVLLGITDAQAEDTLETDADAGSFGISVFTPDAEFSNSWADEDAQTTTDAQSLADNQAINFASGNGVTQHAATFVSMLADGHKLNYSTADGTARKWFELAIGPVVIGPAMPIIDYYYRSRRAA